MESPQAIPEDPEVQPCPPQPPETDAKPPRFAEVYFGTQNCSILTQDKTGLLRLCSFFPPGFHLLERTSSKAVWKNEVTAADPSESTPFPTLQKPGKVWKGDHGKVEKSVVEPEVTLGGSEQELSSELTQESELPLHSTESNEQENSLPGQKRFSP